MERTPRIWDMDFPFPVPDIKGYKSPECVQSDPAETCLENEVPIQASPELSLHIMYKIQYKNEFTKDVVYTKESTKPIVLRSNLESSGAPVLEFITDVYTTDTYTARFYPSFGEKDEKDADPSLNVVRTDRSYLKINSPAIINALRSIVKYYPEQDFSRSSIWINEPFAVLFHYEKELADFRDQYAPSRTQTENERCERTKNTYGHLSVLQEFLQGRIGTSVESEKLRHKRGFATFEMLWLLLKPGVTVFCDTASDGNYSAYIVRSLRGGVTKGHPYPLQIDLWNLNYDGETIGSSSWSIAQQPFNGEKEIETLQVFPCEFWKASKSKKVEDLKKDLEERGKMFFKLTSRRCMSYNGLTTTFPKFHVGT